MERGFGIPVSGSWATPAIVREVCRKAEQLGYASLWSYQRTLYPEAASIPVVYRSVHDPLAISAYVAGVTERARIGLAVVNLPFYSPLVLAKALTSIDVLSGGRLDAGLGLGWSADEFRAAGAAMEERGARAEEFLQVLQAVWGEDPVEHTGRFYEVPRSIVLPKPVQRPGPPLLLGGTAEVALRRAGRLAEGWISSSGFPLEKMPWAVETLRAAREEAGKGMDGFRVVVRGVVRVRDEPGERAFTGPVDKVLRDMETYASYGVTELFVDLNFDEEIGSPDADPAESLRRAHAALEAFAPPS
ncbi:MAG TPA: TIGR03619 family F420-dependent LLM class oxidoreductase [Mycobacteriales bacterium]|nr:TIGR03619 family F420-dependent LLM class oxidoreductase [Mycobacteriales bacterium]